MGAYHHSAINALFGVTHSMRSHNSGTPWTIIRYTLRSLTLPPFSPFHTLQPSRTNSNGPVYPWMRDMPHSQKHDRGSIMLPTAPSSRPTEAFDYPAAVRNQQSKQSQPGPMHKGRSAFLVARAAVFACDQNQTGCFDLLYSAALIV